MNPPRTPGHRTVRGHTIRGHGWHGWGLALLLCRHAAMFCQADGLPVAWGNNSDGQASVPGGLANVAAIAGGALHSLALKSDGAVVAWGFNLFGQTNVPAGLTNAVAVAAGYAHSLALRSNGTVVVWGTHASAPAGLSNVTAIAGGWDHSLALKRDGTIVAWGSETFVPPDLTNAVAVAAGQGYSLALRADNTVVAWGDNTFGQTNVPPGVTNVAAIAAGWDHCLALKYNGTIEAWGANASGQANVPAGLTSVVGLGAGALHSLALRANGTLAAWGDNTYNQSVVNSNLAGFFAVAGGGYHSLALRGNSAPVVLVPPRSQSVMVSKNARFQVMAAGALPLTYQWQRNGTNLLGATNAVLTLVNVQLSHAGTYAVVVANAYGAVTSAGAVLTPVPTPPFVLVPPQDQTTICGDGASFWVTVDGSRPFSYQWLFAGEPIAGATSSNLVLTAVSTNQAGPYAVVVTNAFGAVTSAVAWLTVTVEPPFITSPLTASAKQGQAFSYTITALHTPLAFGASGLPPNLTVNPTNGVISGIATENGVFGPTIFAANACASDSQTLVLTVGSSVPVITSSLTVTGRENANFSYTIRATESPTSFGADPLPVGLSLNVTNGLISGVPMYPGDFYSTISASNAWGVGSATLHFIFTNAPLGGLSIGNVTYTYSAPYLLDFQFALTDNDDPALANPVVVDPRLLAATCLEDDKPISASETAFITARGSAKLLKTYLVLDFTQSIASLANGDSNGDGLSDAVDSIVSGAESFVNQQPAGAQVGVYEFHREDLDPQKVLGLTTDEVALSEAIGGIWTNYVQWFPAGSRCWDALAAAVSDLGPSNADEQHYVVFISDGRDESSLATLADVITAATNNNVHIYCVGYGAELDPAPLQTITSATAGRYLSATNATDLATEFAQIAKHLSGQYILRWATLKRSSKPFMPAFEITYQGFTAHSPTNPVWTDYNNPIIDTNSTPPTTNYPLVTNYIIAWYVPTEHTGSVTVGALRLVADADVRPPALTLRATYVPRYIRQLLLHYRANWPCIASLLSTGPGEILSGWSLTETNDGAGGKWLLASSPYPQSLTNSLPYGVFGNLIHFTFRDLWDATNAFSVFEVDNTIYTNTGRQSFVFDATNLASFITVYPVLPYGTPVPWLMAYGFTNDFVTAEVSDPDGDGVPTWQEFWANTSPLDPASKFAVWGLFRSEEGRFHFLFSTALNRTYRVDSSFDLQTWEIVRDGLAGTGTEVTFTDVRYLPGTTQIYYRVAVY